MDLETIAFAHRWARRYVYEHRPYGLDESDVEDMILRRSHHNKDKGERGRKAALPLANSDIGFRLPSGAGFGILAGL